MKNVMDILLTMDESRLEASTRDIEIKRLSEETGEKVVFTCHSLSMDKYIQIKENATNGDEIDTLELQIFAIIEGVKNPNFKSDELIGRFKAATPKELVKKLLRPGEINRIFEIISELSGFGGDTVQEIKN